MLVAKRVSSIHKNQTTDICSGCKFEHFYLKFYGVSTYKVNEMDEYA
jgi:hypothetical protein